MKKIHLKPITNTKDHAQALKNVEALWNAEPGTEAHDALEVLAILVERYEDQAVPFDDPDPVEAIRFRLEQTGRATKDLTAILGSRSRVSEVMNRKRPLSLPMIRRLHDELKIPFEALIPLA